MILIKEVKTGETPEITLSLKMKINYNDPMWYIFLKEKELASFTTYKEANTHLRLAESIVDNILIEYFEHEQCEYCDKLSPSVKQYEYSTKKTDESNEGTWKSWLCTECVLGQEKDEAVISFKEVIE